MMFLHLLCPDAPNQALRWMYCQWQEYLTDLVENRRYPTSYYTQHCFSDCNHMSWLCLSRAPRLTDLCDLTLLYKDVRCTKSVWFPTPATVPSQFIFYNGRRLLGLYNVTLMRRVRGCAPSGSNLFFFFSFLFLSWFQQCVSEIHTEENTSILLMIYLDKLLREHWRNRKKNRQSVMQTQTAQCCIPLSDRLPLLHKEERNILPPVF